MDTMLQIAEKLKKDIDELLPKSISPAIIEHINNTIDHELTTDESRKNVATCGLMEVDLEENWAKVTVPHKIMENGFHAGSVVIDFSGVQ